MQELVEGCIAGDQRCQRQLFRQYRQSVFSLVYRLLGPGYDLDDIIQQVFIKVFRSLSGFKGLSSLDTWIYRITSKVCTDQLRKKYRKRQLDIIDGSDEMIDFVAAPSQYNPDRDMEQQEISKQVFAALEKLSIPKRTVVVMFEMEQMSLDQISEILNLPVGTVKSRLFHARRDLERHLKRYMENKE
ncbi:MAG: RNA polymerase sigma factor [Chitinispirillaceae bacterium]